MPSRNILKKTQYYHNIVSLPVINISDQSLSLYDNLYKNERDFHKTIYD